MQQRPRAVTLVVNEGARRGSGSLERAAGALRRRGVDVVAAHSVTGGDALRDRLGAVLEQRPGTVVVGGGDGSLSCAAGMVAHTPTVLGLLPLGTANDLARTLQLPRGLEAACDAVAHGHVVDVDLGRADGRPFVNVASAGLSVGVTEALDAGLKRRLGAPAYGVALLRAYRHHRPFAARLEFPDGDHEPVEWHDLLQLAVGNGRHHGGGNAVSPTATIDDGLLDVYAVRTAGLREHLRVAASLKDGSFVAHPSVDALTTRRVRVVTDPGTPLNLDGEVVGGTPALFEVDRNAVHVLVPRSSTAATYDGDRGEEALDRGDRSPAAAPTRDGRRDRGPAALRPTARRPSGGGSPPAGRPRVRGRRRDRWWAAR
ncbi:lipid kinase [Aquipuribacter sp. SD81]|uniref:lipid kinase n=1 Tax=Aquipuribacter sp. SD81 TaxID=3127703 RepID=UPI0030194F56